jgi:hypothetical protein
MRAPLYRAGSPYVTRGSLRTARWARCARPAESGPLVDREPAVQLHRTSASDSGNQRIRTVAWRMRACRTVRDGSPRRTPGVPCPPGTRSRPAERPSRDSQCANAPVLVRPDSVSVVLAGHARHSRRTDSSPARGRTPERDRCSGGMRLATTAPEHRSLDLRGESARLHRWTLAVDRYLP